MKKTVAFVLALMLTLSCVSLIGGASAERVRMWVKTPNGKTVNVRDRNQNIIGRLPYGDMVIACDEEDYWTIIEYGSYGEGWIMSTYLVDYNPGKYQGNAGNNSSNSESVLTDSVLGSQTVNGLNNQYKSLTYVATPYTVKVVPDTKTGTARLRWAPSKFSTLIAYLNAGYELTVLASNKNWLMVRDEESGKIGYIATKYTAVVQ